MPGSLGYRVPVLDRFWAKVEKHDVECACCGGCWHWTGMRLKPGPERHSNGEGYGYLWNEGRMVRAHRLAYELFVSPIPAGLLVMHSCDRPWCVNPAHLSVGTALDNHRDMREKGRAVMGRKKQERCNRGHLMITRPSGRRHCATCNNARRRAKRLGLTLDAYLEAA